MTDTQSKEFDLTKFLFKQQEVGKKRKMADDERAEQESAKKRRKIEDDFQKSLDPKLHRLFIFFAEPTSKLYCFFLQSIIPVFEISNKVLQESAPLIHKAHDLLHDQLKRLMTRFVKGSVISEDPSLLTSDVSDPENQLDDASLMIGQKARKFIKEHPELQLKEFFTHVRDLFITCIGYMRKKFPLRDPLLQHAVVADVAKRQHVTFSDIEYFLERFQILRKVGGDEDALQEQFLMYQSDDSVSPKDRADETWHAISLMLDVNGAPKYPTLPKVMMGILSVFHSNVDCERLFSLVTKNKTKFRGTMSVSTLQAITTRKQSIACSNKPCYQQVHSKSVCEKAKRATREKLSNYL